VLCLHQEKNNNEAKIILHDDLEQLYINTRGATKIGPMKKKGKKIELDTTPDGVAGISTVQKRKKWQHLKIKIK